eukprot:CAMPEP_0194749112 /NCGR_PEP_ID=MMETSP0323_2-20130528/3321_1 /TAXON_ID=2866 ORGANISM="Crypthecodinium cohnii, Strain Seligo" /NCGR_SAMPLE_ID=MMETSP0323_2 /ASSEMBLY_ACC=CAM_ASM_000346 /LENGTH=72 /DNA_ID=CAMNT_0039663975 /DNA_START=332 /DNA_END=550 /DNA_ORIENTATION=+
MGRDVRSGLFDSVAPVNMLEGEQNILCLCPCCASDVVPRVEFTGLRASDDSRRLASQYGSYKPVLDRCSSSS